MNGIDHWYFYGLFALFATFSVYNGQRLIKSAHPTQTPWLIWVQRNEKSLYLITFASGLLTLSCLLLIGKLSLGSILLLIVSGVVSLLYVIPVKGIVMREIPYMKVYLIAFTWAAVLILFPMINEEKFEWKVVIQALAYVFFTISATIPFDVRDLKFDRDTHKTIPQVVGIGWSKVISIILLILFLIGSFWVHPELVQNFAFHAAIVVQFLLILFMNEKRGDLYCAGAIDGAIGLIGLSYFISL